MRRTRLELDYVAAPRRPVWLGLLLLALALGIAADLALRLHSAQQEISRIETMQGLQKTDRPAAKPVPTAQLDDQAKAAQAVVRQLSLPWAALVEVLENAAAKDVALLQVQPDAQQRLLRITAQARHHAAMLDYVRKLTAANMLSDVHITSHQTQLDDPQRPLQFTVLATFRVVQ